MDAFGRHEVYLDMEQMKMGRISVSKVEMEG